MTSGFNIAHPDQAALGFSDPCRQRPDLAPGVHTRTTSIDADGNWNVGTVALRKDATGWHETPIVSELPELGGVE